MSLDTDPPKPTVEQIAQATEALRSLTAQKRSLGEARHPGLMSMRDAIASARQDHVSHKKISEALTQYGIPATMHDVRAFCLSERIDRRPRRKKSPRSARATPKTDNKTTVTSSEVRSSISTQASSHSKPGFRTGLERDL